MDEAKISRREFVAASVVAGGAFFVGAPGSPAAARCASPVVVNPFAGTGNSVVTIQLRGGNDAYNTLVPYTSAEYYAARPNIALRGNEIIKLDKQYAFNAALKDIVDLYENGMMAVFPSVGGEEKLPMSHERASEIWSNSLNVGSRVSHIVIDDFDTHADQKREHFESLERLASQINSLRPLLESTVVFVFSEFGRSFEENDSRGTDHANDALCFAVGKGVRGGIYGATTNNELFTSHRKLCAAVIA